MSKRKDFLESLKRKRIKGIIYRRRSRQGVRSLTFTDEPVTLEKENDFVDDLMIEKG